MKKTILFMLTLLVSVWVANAQNRVIHGTIVDAANNEPLIGATVMPLGGGQGASANADGKFTITVPQNVKKARFSYVGYVTKDENLRDGMTVYLATTGTDLSDVVVVAYGTASKESLTGSVAVVNDKQIEKRPVSSVTAALEGMAPGVQVNGSTSTPGSSPSILIRGINTVNGTTSPLYVVDGVIWNGGINDLNPNDVENISVLKDAASCALYGSKGANGVVLIQTKRAKKVGKVDVNLKISQGIYQRGLPQYERLGYDQWNETMLQAIANGNYSGALGGSSPITREEAFNKALDSYFSSAGVFNLYNTRDENGFHDITAQADKVFDKNGHVVASMMPGYDDTDWWDAISRNGHRQEYSISAAGASEKYNIFASAGYLNEKGYILKTDFERFTGRLRADFTPVKYFKFGLNMGGTSQNSNQPQFDSDNLSSTSNPFSYQTTAPGLPYYEHDWQTGALKYGEDGQPLWNTTDGYPAFASNRGYIIRANDSDYEKLAIDANLYGTVILPYGFEATVRGTMNRWREESTEYGSPLIGSAQGFGRLSKYFYTSKTHTFSQTINWSHEYGNHHVDAMLNHENYSRYYHYTNLKNRDELFPGMMYMNNFVNNEGFGAYAFEYRTESYMARGRYNYNQQYFLEASFTRDGSSRFAKDSRWGSFWSVGASWIITKEKFMHNLTWIDYAKARLSYGTAGNDYTSGYYPAWDTWSKYDYTLNGNPSVFPGSIGNPKLHWEATKTLDAAIETTFLNNRLNFTAGYFLRTNSDLIYSVSQAPSNGTTSVGGLNTIYMNVGDMQNWGWELGLSGTILTNANVTWTAHADATFIKNKIVKLPRGNSPGNPRGLYEGKSRYEWCLPTWAGVDMTTGYSLYEINEDSYRWDDTEVINGRVVRTHSDKRFNDNVDECKAAGAYVEINGKKYTTDQKFASYDLQGTSLPTVYGSFGTAVEWKGLSVGLLFTYALGGKVQDSVYSNLVYPGSGNALHKDVLNAWTPEIGAAYTEDSPNRISTEILPCNDIYRASYNNASSSRFLISRNYLALKNLNIGYDLPKSWVKPMLLSNLNIGMSIDNVFIATKRKGLNPTYNNAGAQGNYFVAARVYSFSLTARF